MDGKSNQQPENAFVHAREPLRHGRATNDND
jgi:hypothetical protein